MLGDKASGKGWWGREEVMARGRGRGAKGERCIRGLTTKLVFAGPIDGFRRLMALMDECALGQRIDQDRGKQALAIDDRRF